MAEKIFSLNLKEALQFGGNNTSNPNVDKLGGVKKDCEFTLEQHGVRVRMANCNVLVPFGNIKGINYYLPTGDKPIAPVK